MEFLSNFTREKETPSIKTVIEDDSFVTEILHEMQRILLRHQIASKWSTIDFLNKNIDGQTKSKVCPLCGHTARSDSFGMLRSHCIFGGGDLLRHICPECEVIFGPSKMLDLTPAELAEDYEWHYKAYEEGDSTDRELKAFFLLDPKKQGTYLNYGAGGWSRSVQQLRAEGWNIYAFEPHPSATEAGMHNWLIHSFEQLQSMRFDGIFSNNVLEHFRYPIDELKKMSELLLEGGRMSHATPCFEYLYEYTRFHLFFFTGRSKNFLIKKAKLTIISEFVDGDFICAVMQPESASHAYFNKCN